MNAETSERVPRMPPDNDRCLQVRVTDLLWIRDLALSASRPVRAGSLGREKIPTNQWNHAACQAIVNLTSELLSTDRPKKPTDLKSDTEYPPASRQTSQRKH